MPVSKGRREGTYRVTVWTKAGQRERIVEGTKADAKRFERELQHEFYVRSVTAGRAAPRFVDFCEADYEPYARVQFGRQTWDRNRKYTVATLASFFGEKRLDRIEARDVERFKALRKAEGLENSTVNAELTALRAMLRWARDSLKLPCIVPAIKMLKLPHGKAEAWSTEQVRALYAAVAELMPHLSLMLRVMLNTGVRKGEAYSMQWSWVDERARLLRIPANRWWKPKSGRAREVPIDGILPALLELPRSSEYVFLSTLGTPWGEFPQHQFTECRRKAQLPGSPHWTRHTYASHFLQARPDLGLLARVLGHSTTRVTELYAHMLPGHMEQARNAVNL